MTAVDICESEELSVHVVERVYASSCEVTHYKHHSRCIYAPLTKHAALNNHELHVVFTPHLARLIWVTLAD